jgi:hypothetical protein
MKKVHAIALALILTLICASGVQSEEGEQYCNIAKSAIDAASDIRGLKAKKKVPCLVHTKEQVKGFLLHTIDTKLPEGKLKNEGILYKALGMIPEDFGYEEGLVEMYISQIGGYYDPEKQHFVMAGWMPGVFQTTIAVHELTHALQDQYFSLDKFMDHKIPNSDLLMARSALVEGDATAVMVDYSRRIAGQPQIETEDNVEAVMMQNVFSAAMISGFGSIPSSLQNLLIFPYTSGLRFAHTLLLEDGYKAVDKAFKNPPESTEEILHPEKYLKGEKSYRMVTDEEVAIELPEGAKEIYKDVFGEFGTSSLLGMFHKDKRDVAVAAAGWGGDRASVFEDKKGVLHFRWITLWDTEKDAKEFYASYSTGLKQNYSTTTYSEQEWVGDNKHRSASLQLEGKTVIFRGAQKS